LIVMVISLSDANERVLAKVLIPEPNSDLSLK